MSKPLPTRPEPAPATKSRRLRRRQAQAAAQAVALAVGRGGGESLVERCSSRFTSSPSSRRRGSSSFATCSNRRGRRAGPAIDAQGRVDASRATRPGRSPARAADRARVARRPALAVSADLPLREPAVHQQRLRLLLARSGRAAISFATRCATRRGRRSPRASSPIARDSWPRLLYHRYMMLVDQSATPRPDDRAGGTRRSPIVCSPNTTARP